MVRYKLRKRSRVSHRPSMAASEAIYASGLVDHTLSRFPFPLGVPVMARWPGWCRARPGIIRKFPDGLYYYFHYVSPRTKRMCMQFIEASVDVWQHGKLLTKDRDPLISGTARITI
jgi:hypothetical protein